ncbi:MAG: hypothetical protein AAFO94_12405 [Bacteroidota bacterium]
MNIEIRKFKLIQNLMRICDAHTIDTVETLLDGVFTHSKQPRQDSATDLPSPKLRKEKIKKKKEKRFVYTLDELVKKG